MMALSRLSRTLVLRASVLVVILPVDAHAGKGAEGKRPVIKKLGIDCDMVETTPVVFKDWLLRFEYVGVNYHANKTGNSYFRFVDVATGQPTPPFGHGNHLGCAFVQGDQMYAFGVDKWSGSTIRMFRSKDLKKWEARPALHLSVV